MSFGEELSAVDSMRMAELFDELFRPGNKRARNFWVAESAITDYKFPVFRHLIDKVTELTPLIEEMGFSEDHIKGMKMGIDSLRVTFGVYAKTEVPDAPPELNT